MHFKNLAVVLPLALLAACGGSGAPAPEGTMTPDATPATEAVAESTQATAAPAGETATTASAVTPVAAAAQPPAAFAVCAACHSPAKGMNGVGPSLYGIVGTKAGDVPGYAFSSALKASGIVWNRDTLDTWLQGPMKMVPGTKMVIAVPDAAQRKQIIDFLETLK